MSVSMYQASIPLLQRMITNLIAIIEKAETQAGTKKIDLDWLVGDRLAADMFPLKKQIQLVSDFAKGTAARLAGKEIPKWEDNEKSLADLKGRLIKTVDYLKSFKPADIDGSEGRDINLTIAQKPATLKGQVFLQNYAFPHFFFHVTTAYNILRKNGFDIGKRDYMGPF